MTYSTLALPFLGVAVGMLGLAAWRRRPDRRWWLATASTLVVLLVLTVVFDNLMIAADLFRYDDARTAGVTVGLAPVEDLAWPLAAALGLPSLTLLLDRSPEQVRP
jgi:lycopene cyclase domain-containing protein